jgi:5'-nucleotidase
VIALTHMRTPNDIRLAENVPEVDLILGGHDHVYEKRKVGYNINVFFFKCLIQVNGTYILKSGTDFRQFSKVTLDFKENPVHVEIEAVDVTKSYEPDVELDTILEKYTGTVTLKFMVNNI